MPGYVLSLDGAGRDRVCFAMTALGAVPAAAVAADGAVVEAYVAAATGGPAAPWAEIADPRRLQGALAEAVAEIMAHHGRRPAEAMPALMPGIAHRAHARQRGRETETPVVLRSGLGAADVAEAASTIGYARHFAVEDHRLRHRRFDGRMSQPIDRAVFASGDAVTVLPFDPRRGTVLLIEQFRPGPYARRDPDPWCLEVVAGRCDGLEAPEETARREAREEAGLRLGRLERIAGYYSTPGIAAEFITGFVGEADLGEAGGVHGLAVEDEDIRALVVPVERALAAVASGEVNNAPLLISLYWLDRHRARLTAAWADD